MKLHGLIIMVISIPLIGIGQVSIERQVLSSGGNQFSNNDLQVAYTLGETFVTTLSSSELIITQGFQQPDVVLVGLETREGIKWEVNHYPNPAQSQLTLDISGDVNGTILLRVMDVQGGLIHQEELVKGFANYRHLLSVDQWAAGMYILSLQAQDSEAVNLPFQKVN